MEKKLINRLLVFICVIFALGVMVFGYLNQVQYKDRVVMRAEIESQKEQISKMSNDIKSRKDVDYRVNKAIRNAMLEGCSSFGGRAEEQCYKYIVFSKTEMDMTNPEILLPSINQVVRSNYLGMLSKLDQKPKGEILNQVQNQMLQRVETELGL